MSSSEKVARNLELQADEIEALKSIYGTDFTVEDPSTNTFSVLIHIGDREGEEATLVISPVLEYPSLSPPIYHLSIPWIRGVDKQVFHEVLDRLYKDSKGDSVIVYVWVEKIRELLSKSEIKPTDKAEFEFSCLDRATDKEADGIIPRIITGDPLTDRKSTFQAHVAQVGSVQQVKLVLAELRKNKKIASATHNMFAYRISNRNPANPGENQVKLWYQDCDDDGETHAGGRLLHLLQILDCQNVLIVVSRWYGGVMLYGDRFKHINNVARTLLHQNGYNNNSKVNASSTKKVVT